MMLVPALLIWLSIDARAPLPIATMTITAATPMIRPSAVSAVRIALRRSARTAIQSVFHIDMASSFLRPSDDQRVFVGARLERLALVVGAAPGDHGAIPADPAVAEGDDAARVLGDVGLVRDEHDGEPCRR